MGNKLDNLYHIIVGEMKKKEINGKYRVTLSDINQSIESNLLELEISKELHIEYKNSLRDRYTAEYGMSTIEEADVLRSEKLEDWFDENKPTPFFNRYSKYLRKMKIPESVIEKIRRDSRKTLELCSNPNAKADQRKGLVIGDVQSGKTSNYLGLINMAADHGYDLIIILAGTTEILRRQTQIRVDEGFVGVNADTAVNSDKEFVGVGLIDNIDKLPFARSNTTRSDDFTSKINKNAGSNIVSNVPIVLVVKKQVTVLKDILRWADNKNLLLIDDEADNASVNTKKNADDPTAINRAIRKILESVPTSTYVGYTATPYANIFIDTGKEDDLFPRDFILNLKSSAEYFGANKVFSEDNNKILRILDEDEEFFLKKKHKREHEITQLPQSLKEAIYSFLLNSSIYSLNGNERKHRSMLINITIFKDLHKQLSDHVKEFVDDLKNIIKETNNKDTPRLYDEVKEMHNLYVNEDFYREFQSTYTFNDIRKQLLKEIQKINVAIMNASQKFNYDDYSDEGARVIAIGGYVLSRGFTLDGLMVSYYNRSSTTFDTMLQMCRWFGYKMGYENLCRVYMTKFNIEAFRAVIQSDNDLKKQFSDMALNQKTPKDYIFKVMEFPDILNTLLVTSRNKMSSTVRIVSVELQGRSIEATKISNNPSTNTFNYNKFRNFVEELKCEGLNIKKCRDSNTLMIKDIEKEILAEFVSKLKIHTSNYKFDVKAISGYMKESDFSKWDILIAQGNEKNYPWKFNGHEINRVKRMFYYDEGEEFLRVSGKKNRILSPTYFLSGLTAEEREIFKEQNDREVTDAKYLSVKGRKPLFIVMPLKLTKEETDIEEKFTIDGDAPTLAFGLGVPGEGTNKKAVYRINATIKVNEEEEDE